MGLPDIPFLLSIQVARVYEMHIQVVKGYQIITDCKEHLVNMTRHHWTRAPQLYGLSYCLMTFLYRPNWFLHLCCHKLAKPHNSHSSMSHKPYNQLCLVTNLSTLFTMMQHGYRVLISIRIMKNLRSGMTKGNTSLIPISVWYGTRGNIRNVSYLYLYPYQIYTCHIPGKNQPSI